MMWGSLPRAHAAPSLTSACLLASPFPPCPCPLDPVGGVCRVPPGLAHRRQLLPDGLRRAARGAAGLTPGEAGPACGGVMRISWLCCQ